VFIYSAASQVGVAAAAAAGKEAKYLYIVNQSGGDFVSLVCETFSLWPPFALSTLFIFADTIAVKNWC